MLLRTIPYTVRACGQTDVGLIRENNEDAWKIIAESNIFILADGMGGHAAGEVAAQTAVESYVKLIKEYLPPTRSIKELAQTQDTLSQLIGEVNKVVYRMSRSEAKMHGMGTTLCCSYFHPDGLIIGHVGDSRTYIARGGQLHQLTEDHSLVQELVGLGELSPRQAKSYSHRNIITKAIGTEPFIEPALYKHSLQKNDLLLMCSDGLTDLLSDQEILNHLIQATTLEQKAASLIEDANRHGGNDNVTVILMEIDDPDSSISVEEKVNP